MFKADSNGQSSGNDFEKVKLRQKVEKLQDKLDKKR